MDISFRSRQLERRFTNGTDAIRAWGPIVGRRYVARIRTLRGAPSIASLYDIQSFDLHPLTGDRAGQYAIRLTGQVRLIVTLAGESAVMIEEVVDYHG